MHAHPYVTAALLWAILIIVTLFLVLVPRRRPRCPVSSCEQRLHRVPGNPWTCAQHGVILGLMLLIACVATACAPAHPGYGPSATEPTPVLPLHRVASTTIINTELEAVAAGLETGMAAPPYYVVRADNGQYCLTLPQVWARLTPGTDASCYWRTAHR